jgi:hypothetical protein
MNPLDFIPKFVWVALVAVLGVTSCKLKIENGNLFLEVEKHATRVAELRQGIASAQANAAEAGRVMEAKARAAAQAALVREKSLAADRARALSELDGLRVAVAKAQGSFGLRANANTIAPDLNYPGTITNLFLDCSRRYQDMAAIADGHLNDALTLQESWPRNPISKLE